MRLLPRERGTNGMTPRRIIDAHTHVWDLKQAPYRWLTPESRPLDRTYKLGELLPELRGVGVDAVVLVQADDHDGDTENMRRTADAHPEVAGIVAWMCLTDPSRLHRRLAELAEDPRVVGVRCLIHDMADPDWILRDDVSFGLGAVARAGLSFDYVTASPKALAHVPTLARRHPELRIIIDHLGKPPVGGSNDALAAWGALLADAARHGNVAAKLSGLYSAVGTLDSWNVDSLKPAVNEALDLFGAERLMYGGDWPVALVAGGYSRWFEGLAAVLRDLGDNELNAIYADTATAWYRLQAAS